jgi:hypothetical protein
MYNDVSMIKRYRYLRGRCGRMTVGFMITYAISAYHQKGCEFESRSVEIYSIQHYVIKFISDLRQVGGFLRALRFHPPIKKNDRLDIAEILLKVAINTITLYLFVTVIERLLFPQMTMDMFRLS